MNHLIAKMSKIFSDSMNHTNGRRILNSWCDMPYDIKNEVKRSMGILLNELIKSNDITINTNKDNKIYKYLYIISAYEGGRGYVARSVYKMNINTEEIRNACKKILRKIMKKQVFICICVQKWLLKLKILV